MYTQVEFYNEDLFFPQDAQNTPYSKIAKCVQILF